MSSTLSDYILSSDEEEKQNENTDAIGDDSEGNSSNVEESSDENDASNAHNFEVCFMSHLHCDRISPKFHSTPHDSFLSKEI